MLTIKHAGNANKDYFLCQLNNFSFRKEHSNNL